MFPGASVKSPGSLSATAISTSSVACPTVPSPSTLKLRLTSPVINAPAAIVIWSVDPFSVDRSISNFKSPEPLRPTPPMVTRSVVAALPVRSSVPELTNPPENNRTPSPFNVPLFVTRPPNVALAGVVLPVTDDILNVPWFASNPVNAV